MTRTRMAAAAALALTGVLALAGCASLGPKQPTAAVAIDRTSALAAVNAFRAENGRPALTVSAPGSV